VINWWRFGVCPGHAIPRLQVNSIAGYSDYNEVLNQSINQTFIFKAQTVFVKTTLLRWVWLWMGVKGDTK